MAQRIIVLFCIVFCCRRPALAQNDVVKDAGADSDNRNKPERVEWFRTVGEGLFIHFGVDAPLGIVISHSLVGASDDYVNRYFQELPAAFDPSRFDPRGIARLARLAGMRYIVFTTKHHSGFCLWDTRTTTFNCMQTPYHRDMLKEFVEATRAEGLGVGLYFSPEDFHFLYEHGLPINRGVPAFDAATRAAYDEYTRRQCEELMTQYGPIDVLFIDGDPKEVVKRTCWGLQPDLLITRGAMATPEQVLPGARITDPWLSCITMGTAWQYQPTNERYKSGTRLIGLAIEARAKGGSLLLNVGPKPDGELAQEQEDRLREMAAWYFVNHECMDSVGPWVVSREGDTWFTARGDSTVYAIVTGLPGWEEGARKTFLVRSVKATDATRISVLGQNSRLLEYRAGVDVGCRYRQTAAGLELSVVRAQRIYDDHHWPDPVVIKLEKAAPAFREAPAVFTGISRIEKGNIVFTGKVAGMAGGSPGQAWFEYRPYLGQTETLYTGPWKRTAATSVSPDGSFRLRAAGLDARRPYEYRAVLSWHGVGIDGEDKISIQHQ
jgi:alpha-L-fucosidase